MPPGGAPPFRVEAVRSRGQLRHALVDRDGARVGLAIAIGPGETPTSFARELGPIHARATLADAGALPGVSHFAIEALTPSAWSEVERTGPLLVGDRALSRACIAEGKAALSHGDPQRALACFEAAMEADPWDAVAHYHVADRLESAERLPEALDRYDAAVRLAPEFASAWSDRAHALGRLRRYEEAIASCERAIAAQPELLHAWLNKASFEAALGRIDAACDSLEGLVGAAERSPKKDAGLMARAAKLSEDLVARRERARASAASAPAAPIANVCPSCGETNRAGAPFCSMCKTVLVRARPSAPAPLVPGAVQSSAYRDAPRVASGGAALVFLEPPHASALDLDAIARVLGLALADARMRVGLASPAPVMLTIEGTLAESAADQLRRAGLRALAVPVAELLGQSPARRVAGLSHDAHALRFETPDGARGAFGWADLRAAFLVVQTTFEQGPDAAGRAALARASAALSQAQGVLRNPFSTRGMLAGGRRALNAADRELDVAGAVKRNEVNELTLHLVALGASGRAHVMVPASGFRYRGPDGGVAPSPAAGWTGFLANLATLAPHVTLDRRGERVTPRLPPLPGIATHFGGRAPDATDLYAKFLAWRASR